MERRVHDSLFESVCRMRVFHRFLPHWHSILSFLALVLILGVAGKLSYGQAPSATLTGTVLDQSNAVVPEASVMLKDQATGALRRTLTNREGFFTIPSIPAGTYTLTVEARGFAKLERTSIKLYAGDRINLPDLVVPLAGVAAQVEVQATPDVVIPVDSGEKAPVITSREIQNLSIIGRNAVDLLKILPGVVADRNYTGEAVQFTTSGAGIGNFYVAGTRNDALDIVSDGANVIDPGCNCGSAVNPNVDMIQEMKVQMANFSAENTRGPVVIQTVSKAGTKDFHGEAYIHLRNHKFNSADWQNNRYATTKPKSSYYYPGFQLGGPLTKRRDKAFFFGAVEWMRQNVDLGVWPTTTPTAAMRQGDFGDASYLNSLNGAAYDVNLMPMNDDEQRIYAGGPGEDIPFNAASNWGENPLTANMLSGGVINPGFVDPGGAILLNLYPLPNRDPATNNGYNYVSNIVNPQNRRQDRFRIDYNISDNTKLYTVLNHEAEHWPFPYTLWWNNPDQVPTPSRVLGENRSYSTSTSLVHVLNPTTTNEVIFAATYLGLPNRYEDPQKVSRKALGYPYKGIFNNDVDILPSMTDWGGGMGTMIQPGGFDLPGGVLAHNKWIISAGDNFSKVASRHLLKLGAYFQLTADSRDTFDVDQGWLSTTNWGGNSTGNAYADLLMGRIGYYQEFTHNPRGDLRQPEFSFYVQDNWKTTRRLTLELGARFSHYGWMYDTHGFMAGWDPSKYDPNAPIEAYTGIVAAYRGDPVPRSIARTPALRVAPRFGFAYDLTGKGNTVIRGGVGQFYYRDQANVPSAAMGNPPLQRNLELGYDAGTLASIDQIDPTVDVPKANLRLLDPNDDRVPTTYSWSLTLSHRLPYATVLEASYVGNTSRNQVTCDGCFNINVVPEGAMVGFPLGSDPNDYRPYQSYGTIGWMSHILNQHYHSLQVTANRQTGRVNYAVAYTFGKVLGVAGGFYSGGIDPFDRRGRSYRMLDYDRTHTLSIAYNIFLPDPARNPFLKHVLNGWQISGISRFQSGGPFDQIGGGIQISGTMANGDPIGGEQAGAINVLGTPDTAVRPILTCDPRGGLDMTVQTGFTDRQYANPACFAAPLPGENGTYVLPYLKEPGFQNHDLSIFKNFSLSSTHENRKLQFRASAYNFLNHPTPIFIAGTDPGLALTYENGVLSQDSLKNFGRPANKLGRRIIQFGFKFMF